MLKGLFLNGEEKITNNTYPLYHPHTEEKIANITQGTQEDMKEAISAAHNNFAEMKALTSNQRANILFEAADRLLERQEEAAQIISKEASKPIKAARGEVNRTIQTLRFSGEEAKRLNGEYLSLDAAEGGEGRDAFTIHEPLGVIGAITPFNFPLNLTTHKVGPAVAAGNPVVIKPAEQTPLSSILLAEILTQSGLPKGAIAVIPGDGPALGEVMNQDERVKKISFTGSPEVGKLIKSKAGLKRVTLELGSNAAMYVDESCADQLNDIASKAAAGAFSYNGQVCLSTQRIYVHESLFEPFKQALAVKTKEIVFGDPAEESTVVSSLINKKSQQRVLDWIAEAKANGAEVLTGGKGKANGVLPTVLANVDRNEKISCNEVFGPVVLINKVKNASEALEQMNDSRYGLNAGIFSNNLSQAMNMAHQLEVGQVLINDVPTLRFDHMPYGGVKDSGYGREGVKYAIEEMTELKMISLNYKG
ncbi:aldehyde dehydrogenase family protein [Alteribacillus bidgolensis]|uniref:Acyl-CoA reductase n=1 Tax=Alteribacillus bidgolensis TaxID=930129 RepID=A0A1G8HH02_9BACI|nr:aldehyde dehydrogenase family protein [Alteribacillus bidgolensis]SDI05923.1 Acyl-CoA reductase [Alteribacillus bidgolensis]